MLYIVHRIIEGEPQTPQAFVRRESAERLFDEWAAEDGLQVISQDPDESPELLEHEADGVIAVAGDDVYTVYLYELEEPQTE